MRLAAAAVLCAAGFAGAQVPPDESELRRYTGVHRAAAIGAIGNGADPNALENDRYDIVTLAAAHLGHAEVVRTLIRAGAPLDHVNNLGWTALMESIVLGDGGPRHVETLRALVEAGADRDIPDRSGLTALQHAERRGYAAMAALLRR